MKASDVATELDMRIAVALSMTADSTGPLGGTVKGLNKVHEAIKAELAAGRLTDAQYAKKAGDLLNILRNFNGLIANDANGTSQR
jgi:hypothetical protein